MYVFLKCLHFIVPDDPQEKTAREYRAGTELLTKYVVKSKKFVKLTANWVNYHAKHKFRPVILCKNVVKCSVFWGGNLS